LKHAVARIAALTFIAALAAGIVALVRPTISVARPGASPSPSPTTAPTPYMPLDEIPNGSWDVIEQTSYSIVYSKMTLKEIGDTVTGTWILDKNTIYTLTGSRQGAHITLQIMSGAAPTSAVLGTMTADIDGIADMVGSITLGTGTPIAFQGAQHGRVPAPVDAGTPAPEQTPF
jgi:hypothetical protein